MPSPLIKWCFLILLIAACHSPASKDPVDFQTLDKDSTGIAFSNTLHPKNAFNVFDYMYFYNGSGVGAGDFNNDGKIDLFFAANQEKNRLFLNEGNLHFRDVTDAAAIPQDKGWSTGVSVIDINNDGLLDIYICKVGQLDGLPKTHNQLLVCQGIGKDGIPKYEDQSAAFGLDFSGFSTQAAFFDYDNDGDLDMYLMNHSIHQNGTFGPRKDRLAATNPYSGDRLFRNEGNDKFTDVTKQSGINSSVIGYGLGLTISDIDLDGFPDLYVGNDFHENDYLYINQHNGTFRDEMEDRIMHTSQFSMGVDIADANNDGFPEIVSMDMLPYDPYILKRSEGEDTWDIFHMKIGYGYSHQYTRNNLQLNRRNGHFSEIGLYAGIAATDWSWSPLWMDFDNDGRKDLFISNGIPKRLNDIDYINFISNQELQNKMRNGGLDDKDMSLVNKFPQIKLPSKFFRNTGDMQFADLANAIGGARPLFSNGAAYADLDGDGDLDIIVNNIDDNALVYRNNASDRQHSPYLDIRLEGPEKNRNALGAKVFLFTKQEIRSYEKYPVHGFLSSMETPIHIGLKETQIDSLFLVWPDNTFQKLTPKKGDSLLTVKYTKELPKFDYTKITSHYPNTTNPVKDITASTGLLHNHEENSFQEFEREPLLPHMLSTEGPALAIGDMNKDGLQDVFIGSSKWKKSCLYLQQPNGKFTLSKQPAFEADSTYENVDACWMDVNNDGNTDLVVASGGNEYYGQDTILMPRVYLNNGKGLLEKSHGAFPDIYINASCILPIDLGERANSSTNDQPHDLFIGARSIPFDYGTIPQSYLLRNDGKGKFTDVTKTLCPELEKIGFVTHALWFDLDKNGKKDLILSLEWGGIIAFMNNGKEFTKKILTNKKGWWNFILPVDLDNNGQIDLIAGNLGMNSRLKATETQPLRLYHSDFDNNGIKEQLLTYYINGRELPFANKHELERQLPILKKNFLYAEDFAKANLTDLFPIEKLRAADTLCADYLDNAVLINDGHQNFTVQSLPWEAQLTAYRDAVVVNANNDDLPDILLVGNYYENNIQMGRYDADYGTLLLNQGKGHFSVSTLNGTVIKGQTRHIQPITIGGRPSLILVRNNDSTRILQISKP